MISSSISFCCLQGTDICPLPLLQLHTLWSYILCKTQAALHLQDKAFWKMGPL